MYKHCISYICNNTHCFAASLMTLLGAMHPFSPIQASTAEMNRFALLGDSMTWIGGDDCGKETGWSHILKESGLADKIDIYARSGATWTNTASTRKDTELYTEVLHDDNVVYNQAIRLILDSDSTLTSPSTIIIFAGANDAWFSNRRPGIFSKAEKECSYTLSTPPSEATSLFSSVALTCDLLQNRFPDSEIVLVTPLEMSKTDAETIHKVSDIIEEAGKNRGCHVIRADRESGILHEEELSKPRYTYDGVHTNPEGARLVGDLIVKKLQIYKGEKLKSEN